MAPPSFTAEHDVKEHLIIVRIVLLPVHVIAEPASLDAVHEFHMQEVKVVEVVTERKVE